MISFDDAGKGPALVLLHGFCLDRHIWVDYQKSLSTKYRVISIDIPGFGGSNTPDGVPSLPKYAAEIRQLLDRLEVEEYIVIGHSLGGYIALAMCEAFDKRMKGLGLFHSTAFADPIEKLILRDHAIDFIETNGLELFAGALLPPLFCSTSREKHDGTIKELIARSARMDPNGAIAATLAMKGRKDRTSVLSNANFPVLFIFGKEDAAIPMEACLEQCHLPENSTVHFLHDCGHMGMIERKEDCIKAVDHFMDLCF